MKGFLKNFKRIFLKNSFLTHWEKRILSCAYISNFKFDVEFPSSFFYIFGFTDWAPYILHPINSFNMSFPQLFYLFVGFYLDGRHVFSYTAFYFLWVILTRWTPCFALLLLTFDKQKHRECLLHIMNPWEQISKARVLCNLHSGYHSMQ